MSLIPPIRIDLNDLANEFSLKQEQADLLGIHVVNAITDRIFYNWTSSAKQGLHSTRKQYLQNLQIGQTSPLSKYIVLTGDFPNMIETGFSAFDMKSGFSKGGKVKIKKNGGWYMTVPFRFATPGAIGESEIFSNIMPPDVYRNVRNLQSSRTQIENGRTQRSKSLNSNSVPEQFRIPRTREAFSNVQGKQTFSQYQHKSSIYTGISRQEKTYGNSTQGSYISFRRVSDKSDPMSWIHKGVNAKNFAKDALQKTDVGNLADRAIDSYLNSLGF